MEENLEGEALATITVAEMTVMEVARTTPTITAEETAMVMVEVPPAMGMVLQSAMQAMLIRTSTLAQETATPRAQTPLSTVGPLARGLITDRRRVIARQPLRRHAMSASSHRGRSTPLLSQD